MLDKNQSAVNIFNKLAEVYEEKFMDVSLYHNTFDSFCNSLKPENASILELACGPGNITQYLLKKRPDLKILATDLAPRMLELGRINNPTAEFQLMDSREIAAVGKKYDGIMCGFCLPYLSKEEAIKLIRDAAIVLNAGGVIYISTMEDDYSKSAFKKGSTGDEIFMHYHQADYLTDALQKSGFTVMDLQRKQYPGPDGLTVTDLIIIAAKP